MNPQKLIVVGAGASGLFAANRLAGQFSVTVLEARDRTGGRIHTRSDLFPFPVESGAEFIHGQQRVTQSVLKDAGLNTTRMAGKFYQVKKGTVSDGSDSDTQWGELMSRLNDLRHDTSVENFLKEHFDGDAYRSLRKNVRNFAEGYDAADISRASAFALRREWASQNDEDQQRIDGGYGKMIDALAESLKARGGEIILSKEVRRVEWEPGRVRAVVADGTSYHGHRILITAPLGILQRGQITFSPPPSVHLEALQKIGYGGVIKFFFSFSEDFWNDTVTKRFPEMSFLFSDAPIPTWWTQFPNPVPLLTGWKGGPDTLTLDRSEDALFKQGTHSLQYILDCPANKVRNAIRNWNVADWVNEPFSFGSYAYATVETDAAIRIISQPVDDTIHFAGEAIYNGPAMGTVEAALSSAEDVSNVILSAYPRASGSPG